MLLVVHITYTGVKSNDKWYSESEKPRKTIKPHLQFEMCIWDVACAICMYIRWTVLNCNRKSQQTTTCGQYVCTLTALPFILLVSQNTQGTTHLLSNAVIKIYRNQINVQIFTHTNGKTKKLNCQIKHRHTLTYALALIANQISV